MKIHCMYNNAKHDLEEDESSLILLLKEKLSEAVGADLPSTSQKWIYKGRVLDDQHTISEEGFIDGDTVHVVKTAVSVSSATAAAAPEANVRSFVPVPQFDQAMRSFLSMHSSADDIKMSLSTIHKIVSNIVKNPYEEKYRKVRSSNALIQRKLVSVSGALAVLEAVGFVRTTQEEYSINISAAAWDNLVACQRKLELFLQKVENETNSSASPISNNPTSDSQLKENQPNEQQAMQQLLVALAAAAASNDSGSGNENTTSNNSS